MKKYLLGAFIMLVMLKPAVGIALVSIFAEGMQTAASAMANGAPARKIDAEANEALGLRRGVTPVPVESKQDPVVTKEKEFEERVMSIMEKKQLHEEEQLESQRKLAEAEAAKKAEKAGVELFDEEFNKKFPKR